MRIQKITSLAIAVAVSSLAFVQCGDGTTAEGRQARAHKKFERVDRETPEMKAKRAEFSERGIAKINQAVQEGKLEQTKADFILKRIAHDNAFKDANPEWTKYFFAKFDGKNKDGKKLDGKKPDGKKFEGKKGEKREGKVKSDRAERPKLSAAELKANYETKYQARIDRISQKVSEGKIDAAHADFILKQMASDKAFKDANPDWAEYGFFGKPHHGKHGGKGGERAKKAN